MSSINFAYSFLKRIQQRIELTKETILAGSFKTMEDYKHITGELKGLQFAEREIKEQLESKGNDDE